MRIGALIPTLGNRPNFLGHAMDQLSRQTMLPDQIEIVNDPQVVFPKDLTWRYRIGCDRLKNCDLIFFWEDDDFYKPEYIEKMFSLWDSNGNPDIFGLNFTIYYHLFSQKYFLQTHPKRASAFCTMISGSALGKISWPADSTIWTDLHLWKNLKGIAVESEILAVGIKHGLGVFGGRGHEENLPMYKHQDKKFKYLESIVGSDIEFYREIVRSGQA